MAVFLIFFYHYVRNFSPGWQEAVQQPDDANHYHFPGGREEEHDYFFIVMFWICVLVYIMHLSTLQKYEGYAC